MTGVLLWICIYFIARGILSKAWGSNFTPRHAKQIIVGALILSTAASVATWDVYDKGFWDAKGLLTIKDYDELESMRTQPTDVHVHATNEFTDRFDWTETGIVPTTAWLDWGIFQPGREVIIDFADSNGHQDASNGINAAAASTILTSTNSWQASGSFEITEDPVNFPDGHHETIEKFTTDVECEHRAEERKINDVKTDTMFSSNMVITDSRGNVVSQFSNCAGDSLDLPLGTYDYQFDVEITGPLALNDTMAKEVSFSIASFQPLLVWDNDAPKAIAGMTVNLSNASEMALGAGQFSHAKEVVKNIAGNAKAIQTALNTAVLNTIPGVGGNLSFNDVSGSTRGIVINPNAELLYDSPEMREIGMIFKLVAQNDQEAKDIQKIVDVFREASLPSWGDDGQYENLFGGEGSIVGSETGRTWNNWFSDNDKKDNRNEDKLFDITTADNWIRVPMLCQFTFMTGSDVNRKLIQFKPCAIQAVEVNYTPDGTYATYSDGSPVAIELRLNFMETKLLYSNEVQFGY